MTSDFVYKAVHDNNGRWLTQTKLYWHLQNRDALAYKDEKHWKSKLSQFSKGVTCLWDVKTDAPKVEAIIKSGVLDWIKLDDTELEYTSESEGGQQFLSQAIANKKQIKNALGITVKNDSIPIKLANRLLDRIGFKLAYSSRTETTKYYKLDEELATDADRQAVFSALNLKWQKEKIKMAENQAEKELQRMTNENNILINNGASSGNNKPEELPENYVVEHTTDEWLEPENLVDTAALLEACESAEMIEDVRAAVPSYVLKAASKLLQPSKFIQLKQWVSQLNSVATVQAEVLADTAVLLEACDGIEMLEDLRKYADNLA